MSTTDHLLLLTRSLLRRFFVLGSAKLGAVFRGALVGRTFDEACALLDDTVIAIGIVRQPTEVGAMVQVALAPERSSGHSQAVRLRADDKLVYLAGEVDDLQLVPETGRLSSDVEPEECGSTSSSAAGGGGATSAGSHQRNLHHRVVEVNKRSEHAAHRGGRPPPRQQQPQGKGEGVPMLPIMTNKIQRLSSLSQELTTE